MLNTIKKSINLKRSNPQLKSFNEKSHNIKDSSKINKTKILKDDYYIQISPRLETQNLTFTNSIKKVKIIQNNESSTEIPVKSPLTQRDQTNKLITKMNNSCVKGQYYFNMKYSSKY